MSSVIFQSAQRIISQVFQWLQSSSQGKTSNLIMDAFSVGIDNSTTIGEGFIIVPGSNNTGSNPSISITTGGIGYDYLSNRIYISPSDTTIYNSSNPTTMTSNGLTGLGNLVLTPQSTGCVNILMPNTNGNNYLWIDYLATIDPTVFTLNEITNAKQFYKQTDGYLITVTTSNIAPDAGSIFLGTVITTTGNPVISGNISQLGRQYFNILPNIVPITTAQAGTNPVDRTPVYAPGSTYTLEAHVKAVGTGTGQSPTNPHNMSLADLGVSTLDTVVAHRQLEHGTIQSSGNAAANVIIAGVPGTPAPSTSAMAASINIVDPGSDYLTIYYLLATEFAIVNGDAYNTTNIFGGPSNANVFFNSLPSGTYNVYWDLVVQAFSATTSDISADVTKLWLCTVVWTLSFSPGYNHLSGLIDTRRIGSTIHLLQRWITGGRPGSGSTSPASGEFGFNLTTGLMEYWDGSNWQQPVNFSSNALVPTGAILDFGGISAPSGFLLCDGSVVSQTTYANLFATISTIWNTGGEGAGNFRLPNFQRRTAVGSGGAGTAILGNTVGNTGGAETDTLTIAEIPSGIPVTDSGHYHNVWSSASNTVTALGFGDGGAVTVPGSNGNVSEGYRGVLSGSGEQAIQTSATGISVGGSGAAHNNMQPSVVVTKIIKY